MVRDAQGGHTDTLVDLKTVDLLSKTNLESTCARRIIEGRKVFAPPDTYIKLQLESVAWQALRKYGGFPTEAGKTMVPLVVSTGGATSPSAKKFFDVVRRAAAARGSLQRHYAWTARSAVEVVRQRMSVALFKRWATQIMDAMGRAPAQCGGGRTPGADASVAQHEAVALELVDSTAVHHAEEATGRASDALPTCQVVGAGREGAGSSPAAVAVGPTAVHHACAAGRVAEARVVEANERAAEALPSCQVVGADRGNAGSHKAAAVAETTAVHHARVAGHVAEALQHGHAEEADCRSDDGTLVGEVGFVLSSGSYRVGQQVDLIVVGSPSDDGHGGSAGDGSACPSTEL